MLSEKVAWAILVFLFSFDDVFSYYAITQLGGREANPMIASIVEKYPLLYFVCIPLTVIIMHWIMLIIRRVFSTIFIRHRINEITAQNRLILTAFVIYWPIANSFMNFSFLLGHKLVGQWWAVLSFLAIIVASTYAFLVLKKHQHGDIS